MFGQTNFGKMRSDLVASLIEGSFEQPLWGRFLEGLRNAVEADYAILNFRWPGRTTEEGINLIAGAPADLDIASFNSQHFPGRAPPPHVTPVEGKPYSLSELERLDAGANAAFFKTFRQQLNVEGLTQMREQEPGGVDAWLCIVRHEREFDAHACQLLASLAPELRGVLRHYTTQERLGYAAKIKAEAAERLSFGWFLLDGDAVVLDCDAQAARILAKGEVLGQDAAGRLCPQAPQKGRELTTLIREIAQGSRSRTHALRLSREPWFDLLVTRARGNVISSPARPAVIAYIHGDSWSTSDRCEQLAELFDLYPREAQLALALSRGMTIAESARAFGLTEGTARTYTKSIYTKTGARGLPDLVRIVMRSALAFAPDL